MKWILLFILVGICLLIAFWPAYQQSQYDNCVTANVATSKFYPVPLETPKEAARICKLYVAP